MGVSQSHPLSLSGRRRAMECYVYVSAIAGSIFGAVGTLLGIFNSWHIYNRDRVRVRVDPSFNERGQLCIRIDNRSHFPITIKEIGFTLKKDNGLNDKKNVKKSNKFDLSPGSLQGCQLPQKMDALSSFEAIFDFPTGELLKISSSIRKAYADTGCGKRFTGTSNSFKRKIQEVNKKRG